MARPAVAASEVAGGEVVGGEVVGGEVVGHRAPTAGAASGPEPSRRTAGQRIGIFGGTFDPVHWGHLRAAEAVHRALGLDRTLLVVANEPWQKEGLRTVTAAEDRYAMVAAAVEGHPGLEPSRIEIERGGPSYTIDTVRGIRRQVPGCELVLVMGADVVAELPTWHDEPALRSQVTVAAVDRPGADLVAAPPGWEVVVVPVAPFDVSSTELRSRIGAGLPVDALVPAPVVRCIESRGLYATRR